MERFKPPSFPSRSIEVKKHDTTRKFEDARRDMTEEEGHCRQQSGRLSTSQVVEYQRWRPKKGCIVVGHTAALIEESNNIVVGHFEIIVFGEWESLRDVEMD